MRLLITVLACLPSSLALAQAFSEPGFVYPNKGQVALGMNTSSTEYEAEDVTAKVRRSLVAIQGSLKLNDKLDGFLELGRSDDTKIESVNGSLGGWTSGLFGFGARYLANKATDHSEFIYASLSSIVDVVDENGKDYKNETTVSMSGLHLGGGTYIFSSRDLIPYVGLDIFLGNGDSESKFTYYPDRSQDDTDKFDVAPKSRIGLKGGVHFCINKFMLRPEIAVGRETGLGINLGYSL